MHYFTCCSSMRIRHFFILFCWLPLLVQGHTVKDSTGLLHYTVENGLPTNNVYSTFSDKYGYLWFATDNGAVRYDGYNFKVYNTTNGLPANDVWRVMPDSRGRVWLYTHGYSFGYIENDVYKNVDLRTGVHNIKVTEIEDYGNTVYLLHSLFSSNGEITKLVAIDTNGKINSTVLIPNSYRTYPSYIDTSIYVVLPNRKTFKCTMHDNRLQVRALGILPVTLWKSISTKKFVITEDGMYAYQFRGKELMAYTYKSNAFEVRPITYYGGDADETIYIVSYLIDSTLMYTNKYIYTLNRNFSLRRRWRQNSIPENVQVANFVSDVFGNKWYTTNTDGIWADAGINKFFKPDSALGILTDCKCLGTSANGNSFWWNKKLSILYSLDPDLQLISAKKMDNELRYVSVRNDSSVFLLQANSLYIYNYYTGSQEHFLARSGKLSFKYFNDQPETVLDSLKYLYEASFFSMHQYKPYNFWTTTYKGVVNITKDSNGNYRYHQATLDRLVNLMFDSLTSRYWFYSRSSIIVLDPETDKHVNLNVDFLNRMQIRGIANIKCDRFYNIYIQTDDKIVVYNTKEKRMSFIYLPATLSGTYMDVNSDRLVLAGKFGIAYAHILGPLHIGHIKVVKNIKKSCYNQVNDFVINAYGRLIVNTDRGVFTPHINELAGANSMDVSDRGKFMRLAVSVPGYGTISSPDTLRMPKDAQKISLNLINPYGIGECMYNYKLGDGDWQQSSSGEVLVGDVRSAVFYKVVCVATDEVWNSKPFVFYIYKAPYWYQTSTWQIVFWITGILLFSMFVTGIILLTRYYVARNTEKKRQLTELSLRALYAQINPHFIFNTLSASQYFISNKKFDEAYMHVNKFSRLLRAYIKSSQERYITLSREIEMLTNYIELQQIRFEEKFDYLIEVDNKIPADSIQIPSLLLQPLVENAINHGLFHKKEKGFLYLKFEQGQSTDELVCFIEDNGVGRIRAKELKKERERSYESESFGTTLTNQLIDIFKEYEQMNIYLEYIDKREPETGTIVKLTIRNLKYVA